MKHYSLTRVCLISLTFGLLLSFVQIPVNAAGTKPKLSVTCGQIIGEVDENGTYGSFNPTVKVSYYGLPLKITAYYSEQPNTPLSETGQKITTVEGKSSSSNFYKSDLDFSYKFLQFGQKQTGYYKMYLVAVDNLKRKSTFTCTYKDYYFSTAPSGSQSTNPNTFTNSRGFNRSSCTYNGKKLYGRVYFTKYSFESDFKVYVTDYSFESDLKVYLTDYSFDANSCGKWYPTSYSFDADFKVYLTNYSFESNFKIYETDYSFEAGK